MNILSTIGYGNMPPKDFIKKLKDNKINWIIDVRREGSRSWCRKYWAGEEMSVFLAMSNDRHPIGYEHAYALGNEYDNLDGYREWLKTSDAKAVLKWTTERIKVILEYDPEAQICLLCSEAKAFTPAFFPAVDLVNCHRFHVANALAKLLRPGWGEVRHL